MTGQVPEPTQIPLRWRVAALLFAAAFGAGAVVLATVHRSTEPVVGRLSAVALVGLLLSASGAVLLLGLALLPRRWFQKLRVPRHTVPDRAPETGPMWVGWLALLVVTASVTVRGTVGAMRSAPSPDEEHFVRLAKEIGDAGGILYLVPALFDGRWTESNRHPLFPLLVSICPNRWFAVAVSALAYLGSLGVLYVTFRHLLGSSVHALLGVCLAASTSGMIAGATSALADMLLAFWVLCCWSLSLRAACEPRGVRRALWAVLAGAAFGFGYLTKATAILWCAPILLSTVRMRARSTLTLVLAFGTAVLMASPLLVRNAALFGNPLYNFNQRFLFADTFEEGMAAQPRSLAAEAREFIGRHGWSGVGLRGGAGLAWELFIVVRGVGPCAPGLVQLALGAAALLCGTVGFLTYWSKGYSGWLGVVLVLAWFSFGWYTPIAASARFMLPAVALLGGFAPAGASVTATALGIKPTRRVARVALLWCALSSLVLLIDPVRYLPRL